MRTWKRAAAAVLLTAGLLAGCGSVDGTQTAITVNGEAVSLGTAVLDLRFQQAETTAAMEMYGLLSSEGGLWDQDMGEDEDGNAQTYGQMTKTSVQNSLVQMVLLRQHAAEYGVTLPATVEETATETAATVYAKNTDIFSPIGVSEENVKELLILSAYSTLLYDPITAEVDTEVSDEEAQQSTITYARISASSAESDEEETEDPQATMEEYLAALQEESDPAAADMEALAAICNEDIFVNTYSYGSGEAYIAEEVLDAATDLQDGEIYDEVIETEGGYYYVIRMERVFDPEATETEKASIAESRKQEAYTEQLQSWMEEAEIVTTEAWEALTLTDGDKWTVKNV